MLSKDSRKVLRHFVCHKPNYIFVDTLQAELPNIDISYQINYLYPQYLDRSMQQHPDRNELVGVYRINPDGEAALEEHYEMGLHYKITTGIALIALIKSFMPELTAIVASLWKLLTR
ncbi:hypothetical protein [uncultured Agathobaculum sp.]|uniref:hypothetical protein n=1 Tax=uncultured Agathobaculum sp. TaxID=2048140 RepID=UPI003209AC90